MMKSVTPSRIHNQFQWPICQFPFGARKILSHSSHAAFSQQSPWLKDSLTASEPSHQRAEQNQYFQRVSHIFLHLVSVRFIMEQILLCAFFLHLITRRTNESWSSTRSGYSKLWYCRCKWSKTISGTKLSLSFFFYRVYVITLDCMKHARHIRNVTHRVLKSWAWVKLRWLSCKDQTRL